MRKTTSEYIVVRKSAIHGTGVFAKKDISKGTRVIEYVGEKITKKETERRSDIQFEMHEKNKNNGAVYIFELNKKYDIDGNVPWNPAKYINHSCDPNCETDIIKGKIYIIALRDITKGEEISYNYGFDIDDFENHPCRCGAKNCVGYIIEEDEWPKLRKKLASKQENCIQAS